MTASDRFMKKVSDYYNDLGYPVTWDGEGSKRSLEIQFPEGGKAEIDFAVDGQVSEYLNQHSKIFIQKAGFDIRMIDFEDSNYFHTLRRKMGWGKRGE